MVIEIMRFRLAPGADEDAFRVADGELQSDYAYQQPGLVRRTTARGVDGGDWVVIDLWRSVADADAVDATWGREPVTVRFLSFIDGASVVTERYSTFD
jgi:hypothetical protein